MRNFVDDFAEEAYGDVREGGAFCAVVVDEVVEFGGKDEPRADEQWADLGRFAGAGEARFETGQFVVVSVDRQCAIVAVGPAGALVMAVGIGGEVIDQFGPTG